MAPEPRIEAQAEVTTGDRPLQRMVLSDTCKRSCAPAAQDEKKWYHGCRARLLLCKSMERTGFFWHIRKAFYTLLYIWPSGQNPVEIL